MRPSSPVCFKGGEIAMAVVLLRLCFGWMQMGEWRMSPSVVAGVVVVVRVMTEAGALLLNSTMGYALLGHETFEVVIH